MGGDASRRCLRRGRAPPRPLGWSFPSATSFGDAALGWCEPLHPPAGRRSGPAPLAPFSAHPAAPISSKPASAASMASRAERFCRARRRVTPSARRARARPNGLPTASCSATACAQATPPQPRCRPRLRRPDRDSVTSAGRPAMPQLPRGLAPTIVSVARASSQAPELEQRLDVLGEVGAPSWRRRRLEHGPRSPRTARLPEPDRRTRHRALAQQRYRSAIEGEGRLDSRMVARSLGQLPRKPPRPPATAATRAIDMSTQRCVRKLLSAVLVGELAHPLSVGLRERQPAGTLFDDVRRSKRGTPIPASSRSADRTNSERISRASSSQPDHVRT